MKIEEKDLDAYIQRSLKQYAHRLNPFFQVTLTSVVPGPSPSGGYLCRGVVAGDKTVFAHDLLCLNPGYGPVIGDVVECMWRDDTVVYILWPLAGKKIGCRVHLSANETAWTGINQVRQLLYDAVDYDPNNNYSVALSRYTAPIPGYYRIEFVIPVQYNASQGFFSAGLRKNGTDLPNTFAVQSIESNNGWTVTVSRENTIFLLSGDYIEVWGTNNQIANGATVIGTSANSQFTAGLEVEYVGLSVG